MTAAVVIMLPVGGLVLHNQKLEIQKDADAKYETVSDADKFQSLTNNKLDKLADGMAAVRDDVATIKGQLAHKNP